MWNAMCVPQFVELISDALGDSDVLENQIFGTGDPEEIAHVLSEYLEQQFGRRPEFTFYRHSVGIVVGARVGPRSVVLKVHGWLATVERLRSIQHVQRTLYSMGLPAPRPLAGPTVLGEGLVTVEEFLAGDAADAHDPEVRRVLATELFRLVSAGRLLARPAVLAGPVLLDDSRDALWPIPHSPRFKFDDTSEGAEWIDELAWSARRRLTDLEGDATVGHLDWRVSNLGFEGSTLTAIYDWDSVGIATEPFIVGAAAAAFSSDWTKPNGSLPSLDEMRAFVEEYQAARGRSFNRRELEDTDASNLLLVAYGARCEHSDAVVIGGPSTSGGWSGLLVERGERALTY